MQKNFFFIGGGWSTWLGQNPKYFQESVLRVSFICKYKKFKSENIYTALTCSNSASNSQESKTSFATLGISTSWEKKKINQIFQGTCNFVGSLISIQSIRNQWLDLQYSDESRLLHRAPLSIWRKPTSYRDPLSLSLPLYFFVFALVFFIDFC